MIGPSEICTCCMVCVEPWINKSKAMPDFGDDEWMGMCCVEAVNCLEGRIQLLPGNRHRTRTELSVVSGS